MSQLNYILSNKLSSRVADAQPQIKTEWFQILKIALQAHNSNQGIFSFIDATLANLFDKQRLPSTQRKSALKRLNEIDAIDQLCDELVDLILSFDSDCLPSELTLSVTPNLREKLEDALTQWVDDEYAPIDQRIERFQHKKVRRLDSLSKILVASNEAALAVCGAVTIDIHATPRLIYSSNLGKSSDEEALLKEVNKKISLLKSFYTQYAFGEKALPAQDECINLATMLYTLLFPSAKIKRSDDEYTILFQAVYKLTNALFYDKTTFTPKEKEAFLTDSVHVVLLPAVHEYVVQMQVNDYTPQRQHKVHSQLPHPPEPHEMKFVHAEQLLALYLYEKCNIAKEDSFTFGISKLCCKDCSHFLEHYPKIIFRGHHQKQYQGVINLETGERSKQFTTRLGPLHADASPFKSPSIEERREEQEHPWAAAAAAVAVNHQRLFSKPGNRLLDKLSKIQSPDFSV